jgi:hypothetical protein
MVNLNLGLDKQSTQEEVSLLIDINQKNTLKAGKLKRVLILLAVSRI